MELRRIGGVWVALYRAGLSLATSKDVGEAIALAYARRGGRKVAVVCTCND